MITKEDIDPGLVPIVHSVDYTTDLNNEQLRVTDRYGRTLVIDFEISYIWQFRERTEPKAAPLQPFCYDCSFFPPPNKRPPLLELVEDIVHEWLIAALHDINLDLYLEAFDKSPDRVHFDGDPIAYYLHEPIEDWPVSLDKVLDLVHDPVYP